MTDIKIGMVNYINTAPIYEIWKREVHKTNYLIIEEPPSVLNRMLATGKIDMGFVSSFEYCARPDSYRILEDLSISATGPVGSVFLFSHKPMEELQDRLVLLSNQSETSVCLVKIILEEFHKIFPQYIVGEVGGEISKSCQAVMAIGDDALRLVSSGEYAYQFDLGEIWFNFTGMPFVFSICAVRQSYCEKNPELVSEVHRTLIDCREKGKNELPQICTFVAQRIPMDLDRCQTYLQALEYDLGEKKQLALEKFFSLLIHRGEASSKALPLRFFKQI